MDALHEAEQSATGDERELLYRLRKTCESGLISSQLAEREDELENQLLAERVSFRGEEMPLRNAQARLAVLPSYADREELGAIQAAASAKFNDERLDLLRSTEELSADYSGIADAIERNEEEKDISLRELSRALKAAADASTQSYGGLRERWFAKLLREERAEVPSSYHTAYMRRLSPLESTYTEGARRSLPQTRWARARLRPERAAEHQADLDDRPQKSPRACVIATTRRRSCT
jgi:hypothetical protein